MGHDYFDVIGTRADTSPGDFTGKTKEPGRKILTDTLEGAGGCVLVIVNNISTYVLFLQDYPGNPSCRLASNHGDCYHHVSRSHLNPQWIGMTPN